MKTIHILHNHQVISTLDTRPPLIWHGLIFPRLVGINYMLDRGGAQFYPIFSAPIIITQQGNKYGGCDLHIDVYRQLKPCFFIILSPYPPFITLKRFDNPHMMLVTHPVDRDGKKPSDE